MKFPYLGQLKNTNEKYQKELKEFKEPIHK